MAKKLFVPERMAKSAEVSSIPKDIKKGFDQPEDPNQKNTEHPCEIAY